VARAMPAAKQAAYVGIQSGCMYTLSHPTPTIEIQASVTGTLSESRRTVRRGRQVRKSVTNATSGSRA